LQFIKDIIIEEDSNVGMITFAMSEDNLCRILKHPLVVIGSDGSSIAPYGELGKGKPHPRHYGAFSRVLGKYVRQDSILSLPEAIKKMTSLTANKFNILNRGILKEKYFADIVVFDPLKVIDKADWKNPHQFAEGVKNVIVNGKVVINETEHSGVLSGKIIRRGVL
jgi:N-acyl-D-amino-acid deacylase